MNAALPLEEKARTENEMPFHERVPAKTIFQRLCQTRDAHPNRNAASFQLKSGAKDKAETFNWTELTRRTIQAANLFRSLGVGEKDVVAYLLPTTNETLITLMGGMTAGIVSPINPLLDDDHIAAILRQSGAKVLVTLKAFPKTDLAEKAAAAVAAAQQKLTGKDATGFFKSAANLQFGDAADAAANAIYGPIKTNKEKALAEALKSKGVVTRTGGRLPVPTTLTAVEEYKRQKRGGGW